MTKGSSAIVAAACVAAAAFAGSGRVAAVGDDASKILTIDHYVRIASKVPSIAGQQSTIYVREKVRAGNALRGATAPDKVVLFIHGAGTPAEVAFDVPYKDYSWMGYLAETGFDTFAMDVTGIGRSSRPWPMNDPCNLTPQQQAPLIPALIPAPCQPSYPKTVTTIANDWDDIDAVVNYLRALRRVDKVSTVAWSQGGPRSGGYASMHPEKINRQVMLAPAYNPQGPAGPPSSPAANPVPFNTQSLADFNALWGRQTGCADQWTEDVHDVVWSEMLASDPVGATWAPACGGRRLRRHGAGTRRLWRRPRSRSSWCRACTTARFHRSASASSIPITARRRRSSSIWAVPRKTRCGKRTT